MTDEDEEDPAETDEGLDGISVTYNGSYDKRRRRRPGG